jgi:hypothetical protein
MAFYIPLLSSFTLDISSVLSVSRGSHVVSYPNPFVFAGRRHKALDDLEKGYDTQHSI